MKKLWIFGILTLLLSGCKSAFTDVSKDVISSDIALPENEHYYSAIWLSSNTIIFSKYLTNGDFDPNYLFNTSTNVINNELYSYTLDMQEWKKFELSRYLDCHALDIRNLERLPNNKLGLIQSCRGLKLNVIQEFDISSHILQTLFKNTVSPNTEIKWVGPYAFSPDMTELMQEYPVGSYLSNQLYYIKLGEKPQRIVPDFLRAMTPAWSPHNREIAFWGTASYHGDNDPELKYTWDIIGLASYPWDLYISSPQGGNVRLVLASIENPGDIAWSPTKNIIAFSGTVKGVDGLWFFDPVTLAVTRIWNERVSFGWSPDGSQIVITYVDYSDFPEVKDVRANLIQVPEAYLR